MSTILWQFFINLLLIFTMIMHIQTDSDDILKETDLPTIEMIEKYGYAAIKHEVITQDGYILELHRIIRNRKWQTYTRNYPVVFGHCLLGSSADWVMAGPKRSLGFQLADDGFDVWLVNFRGNTYSNKHVQTSRRKFNYWNFSLHELGVYDLPAIIDFVLETTKTKQIHYVGFSMGTTTFFILASDRPEYQKKIRSNVSLAPVANIYHSTSILKTISPLSIIMHVRSFVRVITVGKFFSKSKKFETFLQKVCKPQFIRKYICLKIFLYNACGNDPLFFDKDLLPLIIGHIPAGTSSKLIVHISQFILTETFGQYDYGKEENFKLYNSKDPPSYNLESIRVPIYIFHGEKDILANPTDVEKLRNRLPNVMEVINNKYFNHLDFVYSKCVAQEINDPIKKILQLTDDENWKAESSKKIQSDNGL